ncbi:hypothetical protein GW932_00095 [archaeon]|nr:hypothetical protein [archaeon]
MKTKVVILSIIALCFLALTYFVDWMFIIGAAIIVFINQKELIKNSKSK